MGGSGSAFPSVGRAAARTALGRPWEHHWTRVWLAGGGSPELKLPLFSLSAPRGRGGRFHIGELVNGYKSFKSLSVHTLESWDPLLPGRDQATR